MPETSLGDSTFSAIRRGHFVYPALSNKIFEYSTAP